MKKIQDAPWWKYEKIDPKSKRKPPTPWWKYRSLDLREHSISGIRKNSEFNTPILVFLVLALLVVSFLL